MSKYTTGELAKLCGVSVRTVQYYDARGILVPSELSEGGRRLYTEQDLSKLKIICYLRELELPIDSIKSLFSENHPEHVISVLLEEQGAALREEIALKQSRAAKLAETRKALRQIASVSVESIGDIAHIMENKKKLRRLRIIMLILGFLMDALQVSTLMIWFFTGVWWPFAAGMTAALLLGVYISALYFTSTAYICPECHSVFKPELTEAFFARHTPNTRRLTCSHCGRHGFCVETYGKDTESC